MRLVPDGERPELVRMMRERARRDAEALTPRPGQPIYGLAGPALTPAAVTHYQPSDEQWTAVTLTYGQTDTEEGPYVAVTTVATDAATMAGAEVELEPAEGSLRSERWPSSRLNQARTGARGSRPGSGERTTPTGAACTTRSGCGRSANFNDCGTGHRGADDAVTVTVNQLGFRQEKAPWFTADPRLRATAIDETLRHAMLGDAVPSERAQEAWARSWSARGSGRGPAEREAADPLAEMSARQALDEDCLRAWAAWAETV